eukprot:CAMPEP_0176465242 /NCGR_PEP_ID=MMETSP0127-20121128/37099_1 /TAXON_ID=938130 /ORGANISM="Platyophrya macrostoma, Strain WH" /LENGTH=68 /DNA_ID=CAMNT_0017858019 /DNA_START=101 /DNA_END=307 /DNA_ORIENTATION=-
MTMPRRLTWYPAAPRIHIDILVLVFYLNHICSDLPAAQHCNFAIMLLKQRPICSQGTKWIQILFVLTV